MRHLTLLFVSATLTLCGCGKKYYIELNLANHIGEKILNCQKSPNRILDLAIDTAEKRGHCFIMTYNTPVYHGAHDSATIFYYTFHKKEDEIKVIKISGNQMTSDAYPSKMNFWIDLYALSNSKPYHCYRTKIDDRDVYISQLIRYNDKIVLQNLPMERGDTIRCTSVFADSLESHISRYCFK